MDRFRAPFLISQHDVALMDALGLLFSYDTRNLNFSFKVEEVISVFILITW